ncbi:MAG: hypothetical protein ACRELB_11260 [Polyangiaceae bacterium]
MRIVRTAAGGVGVALVLLAACGGDDNGGGSGNSGTQPTSCPAPCTEGAVCYQPAPNANCNGTWYCWSDVKWHCAPEEAGGPGGDATVTFESGEPEAGDDASSPGSDGGDAGSGGG